MARISRKTYAAIMTAKEDMIKIRDMKPQAFSIEDLAQLHDLGKDLKVTNAYKTAQALIAQMQPLIEAYETSQAMASIAETYLADFEDVDPAWRPQPVEEAPANA